MMRQRFAIRRRVLILPPVGLSAEYLTPTAPHKTGLSRTIPQPSLHGVPQGTSGAGIRGGFRFDYYRLAKNAKLEGFGRHGQEQGALRLALDAQGRVGKSPRSRGSKASQAAGSRSVTQVAQIIEGLPPPRLGEITYISFSEPLRTFQRHEDQRLKTERNFEAWGL